MNCLDEYICAAALGFIAILYFQRFKSSRREQMGFGSKQKEYLNIKVESGGKLH